jgi:hypothetical protein
MTKRETATLTLKELKRLKVMELLKHKNMDKKRSGGKHWV